MTQVRGRVAIAALVLLYGCEEGAASRETKKVHAASAVSAEAARAMRVEPRWTDFTRTRQVGAAQSASFDAQGNLWLLDGPRVGVLRADAAAPVWSQLPAHEGRVVLASRICGDAPNRAVVAVDAEGSRHLHLELEPDGAPKSLEPHDAQDGVPCEPARGRAERAEAGWRALGAGFDGIAGRARVTAYESAGDDVYIGTLDKGLWRRDATGAVSRVEGLRGRYVRQLHYDQRHRTLVVVTERGVFGLELR